MGKMKAKGQLSIDLMMTVLAVLVFVQMFNPIVQQFNESSKEMTVFNQEKAIAFQVMNALEAVTALYDPYTGTTGSISFSVPLIYEPGKHSGQKCSVMILPLGSMECNTNDNACIKVSYEMKTGTGLKDVNYTVDFNSIPPEWITPSGKTFECGDWVEFTW
jgi:uncharacterized protein (UPF0333 family)